MRNRSLLLPLVIGAILSLGAIPNSSSNPGTAPLTLESSSSFQPIELLFQLVELKEQFDSDYENLEVTMKSEPRKRHDRQLAIDEFDLLLELQRKVASIVEQARMHEASRPELTRAYNTVQIFGGLLVSSMMDRLMVYHTSVEHFRDEIAGR